MTDPFLPAELGGETADMTLREVVETRPGFVSPDDEAEWYDVVALDGSPVELVSCALRVRDGRSSRRGRWLVRRAHHERLLDEGGRYILGVYDSRPEVVAYAQVSAEVVDDLLGEDPWFDDRMFSEQRAQITHSEVFPDLDDRVAEREKYLLENGIEEPRPGPGGRDPLFEPVVDTVIVG